MIISASRRTDIPAFYPEWMMNRLREGEVLVPNPRNPGRLSKIILTPDTVDCIVFWSKYPKRILPYLDAIRDMGYEFYFEYTITAFGPEVERGLPPKEREVEVFCELVQRIGAERVDWRFDPIMVTEQYPESWTLEQFDMLCEKLAPYTRRCIISFLDAYRHLGKQYRELDEAQMRRLAAGVSKTAGMYGLPLYTCAETIDLSEYRIGHSACIDPNKLERLLGCPVKTAKDSGQRPACGCAASVDIGMYDTCGHGCRYCYATFLKEDALRARRMLHNPNSPMLLGEPTGEELVTVKQGKSGKAGIAGQGKLPW